MRKRRQRLFRRSAVLAEPVEGTPDRHHSDNDENEQSQTLRGPHYGLGSRRRCAKSWVMSTRTLRNWAITTEII